MKRFLCLLGAVVVGLATSQLPEFDQQYTQRLGGAVDELRIVTERFEASARASGLSRDETLARFSASADAFIADQGDDMAATLERYERLEAHLEAIRTANPLERVLDLTRYYDVEIGTRTLEAFEPAVPVSVEGLAHLGVGFAAGYGGFWLLLSAIALPFRRRRPVYR